MTDDDVQPEGVDLLNETTTGDIMPTVRGGGGGGNTMPHALTPVTNDDTVYAFDSTFGGQSRVFTDQTPPIKCGTGIDIPSPPAVAVADLAVRRLTPTECERLMGWPDGWTAEGVDTDGNPVTIADSSRYRMCGNGVATPVAEWIGRCILNAEADQ